MTIARYHYKNRYCSLNVDWPLAVLSHVFHWYWILDHFHEYKPQHVFFFYAKKYSRPLITHKITLHRCSFLAFPQDFRTSSTRALIRHVSPNSFNAKAAKTYGVIHAQETSYGGDQRYAAGTNMVSVYKPLPPTSLHEDTLRCPARRRLNPSLNQH